MRTNNVYIATVSCAWLLATLDDVLSMSAIANNGRRAPSRQNLDSGGRGGGCRPREVDDEDSAERRRIHRCCRRYGDDYYDFAEDRWRHRRYREDDYDDYDEESGCDRRRKRFWGKLCRRYRKRYENSLTEDLPTTTRPTTTTEEEDLTEEADVKPVTKTTTKWGTGFITTPRTTKKPKKYTEEEEEEDDGVQSDAPIDTAKEAAALGKGKVSGATSSTTIKSSQATTKPVSISTGRPATSPPKPSVPIASDSAKTTPANDDEE